MLDAWLSCGHCHMVHQINQIFKKKSHRKHDSYFLNVAFTVSDYGIISYNKYFLSILKQRMFVCHSALRQPLPPADEW